MYLLICAFNYSACTRRIDGETMARRKHSHTHTAGEDDKRQSFIPVPDALSHTRQLECTRQMRQSTKKKKTNKSCVKRNSEAANETRAHSHATQTKLTCKRFYAVAFVGVERIFFLLVYCSVLFAPMAFANLLDACWCI